MRGKKGNISITILVIGVFAICGLTLLSFNFSSKGVKNSFSILSSVEKMNMKINDFNFYLERGFSIEESAELSKAIVDGNKIIFWSGCGLDKDKFVYNPRICVYYELEKSSVD